jgi:alpha-tubulin suppressor-like RCC1 family protein
MKRIMTIMTNVIFCIFTVIGGNVVVQVGSLSRQSNQQGFGESTSYLPIIFSSPVVVQKNRIVGGGGHTCALTIGGGVKCWGANSDGQLGDGTKADHLTPVDVVGLNSGVSAIAAGFHTCALTNRGGLKCWGENDDGELGDGTTTDRDNPVDVLGLSSGVTSMAAGGLHTCALTIEGGAKCWGYNQYGSVGDGTTTNRLTPVDVVGFP